MSSPDNASRSDECRESTAYLAARRTLDITGSLAGLGLLSPLLAAAALGIRWTMGSPILFRQERPGRGGEPFELLKFRTMREPEPGEDMVDSDADRITPLGDFLRQTSIDELPTLFNVLKGDMSLVGPRPLLMRYLDRYTDEQARRHEVKPGITGLAQVEGRNALGWEEKFAHDVEYVDNRDLWMDLRLLLKTAYKVIQREGISSEGNATMTEFMGSKES